MTYTILPLADDLRQGFVLSLSPDGLPLQARVEVRFFPAAGCWMLSLWDDASGGLLVNQIPLIASRGAVNDLLAPFRHLRSGRGLGSLFCLPAEETTSPEDPGENTLRQFRVLWGDTWKAEALY